LLKASGLKTGGNASAQDFQNIADTLSKTGAFAQVGWRFNGTEAEYQLIDSTEFVPCIFENIVWLKEEEVITALKKRMPLFAGQVPTNGEMSTEVGTQIESILKEGHSGECVGNSRGRPWWTCERHEFSRHQTSGRDRGLRVSRRISKTTGRN
jgi:hypothetical protein